MATNRSHLSRVSIAQILDIFSQILARRGARSDEPWHSTPQVDNGRDEVSGVGSVDEEEARPLLQARQVAPPCSGL